MLLLCAVSLAASTNNPVLDSDSYALSLVWRLTGSYMMVMLQ